MSLGVNLLIYLTEIASKSLGKKFFSKIYEVHHKHKIDYPSGTALMLGKGIADGQNRNLNNLMGRKYPSCSIQNGNHQSHHFRTDVQYRVKSAANAPRGMLEMAWMS